MSLMCHSTLLTVYTVGSRITEVRRALERQELEQWRARDDLTIEGLVENAETLLREIAPHQTRYKVRERPDVRTIRYYVNRKLLPKAAGYEGGRARYTGAHLLRLLLIKRLQADHWTLPRIARALEGLDENSIIERLLEIAPKTGAQRPVIRRAPPPKNKQPRSRTLFPRETLERFELVHGATVDVPRTVLEDSDQRQALAARLDALAAQLRRAPEKEDEDT